MRLKGYFLFIFLLPVYLLSQEIDVISIHKFESDKYRSLMVESTNIFDSLYGCQNMNKEQQSYAPLSRRVFGYHPYWGGSNYLNYQWDLISDFCHFSYEVDPETGYPLTTHNWESSPAIDSALVHGVRVHLCVTLFSGHGTFFSQTESRQTLIDQIIQLISDRNAHGVNMDVEALPSTYKEDFLEFMIDLCDQMDQQIPEAEVSIAAPAVNWSNKFNIPVLNEYIDYFMVMGYDYYWTGSSLAGPVSPLYPMTMNYNYSFSRTISYYQSQGVPNEKLIMGVPYYAYQWKTEGQFAPSNTVGQGAAYTYRYIKDNTSGYYSSENKHMESNSFGPYYSFELNGWNQCFLDDAYSLGEKYDIINRRNLAGIGIWALGYDNGYLELWNLIAEKFTTNSLPVNADTLYDTGGPVFDYYDDERYSYTLITSPGSSIFLSFSYLDTEENYDTLWIYDGPDQFSSLIGIFTGDDVPELIQSSSNALTYRFFSDGATVDAGWRAVYDTLPVSGISKKKIDHGLYIWPNPTRGNFIIEYPLFRGRQELFLRIVNAYGVTMNEVQISLNRDHVFLDASFWPAGIYFAVIYQHGIPIGRGKINVR